MKTLLTALALVTATPVLAQQMNPVAPPVGVTATVVEQDVCVGVENNLRIHIRNVFGYTRVHGVQWFMNSRGDYLSFSCWHMNMTQRVPQSIAVIYTAPKDVLDAAAREELDNAQRALKDKQTRIRDSGFE